MSNISELKFDDKNFNKHTQYGMGLLEKSLRENGAGRSILIDKDNNIIAGNGIIEAAGSIGLEKIKIVETKGDEIVAVKRTDIALNSKKGREMALADNATAQADLEWDNEAITEMSDEFGFDPGDWISDWSDNGVNKYDDFNKGSLSDRFIMPPFSVLDARKGEWQHRKKQWLLIAGNLSETRNGEFGKISAGSTLIDAINDGTSNFDPVLAETMYRWFCRDGGSIIDPFGGEQTKGVVAGELGYKYDAVEFRKEQVEFNNECTKKYDNVNYYCGDSNNIDTIIKDSGYDLCFTSPPYYDLEVYSKDDMSALGTYAEFMAQYKNIFKKCFDKLADGAFLVLKVGEIRDKKTGEYRGFVPDNIKIMQEIGFKFYNEIILVTAVGTAALRATKAMNSRKVTKTHQNILVFYKGDISTIQKKYKKIEFDKHDLEAYDNEQ